MSHRVVLTFDDGVDAKLICPDSGCTPAHTCGSCGRHVDDTETKPCYDCPPPGGTECWVKGWFDNCTADELLHGALTVEINAEWDGDVMRAHILPAALPLPRLQATNEEDQ